MKFLPLLLFIFTFSIQAMEIKVYKQNRRLEVVDQNKVIKEYHVSLGLNPIGPKTEEGDNKTPEGEYILDYANSQSNYYYAFHTSYPTEKQKWKARLKGKNPGGNIMLHGYPNQLSEIDYWITKMSLQNEAEEKVRAMMPEYDWTNGCIALLNSEIDEIKTIIKVPTKITIYP